MQFISGMKLKGDKLWITSNQVQNLMANVNTTDARYRILLVKSVSLLLKEKGFKCLHPHNTHSSFPKPQLPNTEVIKIRPPNYTWMPTEIIPRKSPVHIII